MPRTNFINLSSNETSPIQNHSINTAQPLHLINTILDTTLALTIPPSTISQTILTQGIDVSPLDPRALVFSTPLSSPIESHSYLTTLDDLSPRNSNPPPLSLSQSFSQTLPLPKPIDFKPSFPPINLSRSTTPPEASVTLGYLR
uniref:Uncharacterized protein n=1 Tax=Tanacetum cinerariifolium TaxID=118510 RepID=A0A6L2L158_TANCI|nr:hypothetical protein [Tanacetum cinerariifolium]